LNQSKKNWLQSCPTLLLYKIKGEIAGVKSDLDRVEQEIETSYRRWEELETIKSQEDT